MTETKPSSASLTRFVGNHHIALEVGKVEALKLADKIASLRDVADSSPADWSLKRRQDYSDWAEEVVDDIDAPPPVLLALFRAAYARRP